MLEEWSFLGTKGDAMGTVSNLDTARKRPTENKDRSVSRMQLIEG